jgi:hypothetical protein
MASHITGLALWARGTERRRGLQDGQARDASVLVTQQTKTEVGFTGTPFTYTFVSQLETIVVTGADGKPHQVTFKAGPQIAVSVRVQGYQDFTICSLRFQI